MRYLKIVTLVLAIFIMPYLFAQDLKDIPPLKVPPNKPTEINVGRFLLATVSNQPGHSVYRIDTATGKTWIYGEIKTASGQFRGAWVPMNEVP